VDDLQTLAAALRARKISAHELVSESLRRIQELEPRLNAFITVTGDSAKAQAARLDDELGRGIDRGPLHGIPIAHKDLVRTKGVRTTAGSKIFANYLPKRDAVVAAKLIEAGAITIGKAGLHELAYGITSNNPHFGAIHNPWDVKRIPGGSSGGSAVAVAAGMVPFATGTDTGGSIRVPASFCGIVGFKPTFGRISTRGVLPLGYTQDHVGPMTRTVRDAAIAFQAMAENPSGYVPLGEVSIRGLRIGWPRNYYCEGVDAEVLNSVLAALKKAEAAGAEVIEIEVPEMDALTKAGATSLLVEAADALRPYLDRRGDFGADVLARLDQGKAILAMDYVHAQRVRQKSRKQFAEILTRVDCIFTPTTPMTAPKIGQATVEINGVVEEVRAAGTRFTRGMNALGLPAVSIPCGFSKGHLPIGLQIIGARGEDDFVLRVAAAMEDELELGATEPPVNDG
jgi:aspartyl-tRNA(Asn)/glutamyl-tRNA(Gln) amidotransferase subunit A